MPIKHTLQRLLRGAQARTTMLRAISALWLGTMAGAALAFATQVALARLLGVDQFGAFSAALAVVTLLAPLAGFGIGGYWLHLFGSEGWRAQRWLPGSLRFVTLTAAAAVALLCGWAWIGPHDGGTAWLLSLLAIHIPGLAATDLAGAKFQLEGRHDRLAILQFAPSLFRLAGVVSLALLLGTSAFTANHAAVAYMAVALAFLLIGGRQMALMRGGRLALHGHGIPMRGVHEPADDRPGLMTIARAAWPYGLAGIFYLIYFQSDIILIRYIVGERASGIYNVAFMVMAAIYLLPGVVYQKFMLPRLHYWAHHDVARLHATYRAGNRVMLALGLVSMLLLLVLAPLLLPRVFGEAYRDSVTLLQILAVAAPFRFVASSAAAVLTTRSHVRTKVRLMGWAALINVGLNFALIPTYGAIGAAVATVSTEALLTGMFVLKVKSARFEETIT